MRPGALTTTPATAAHLGVKFSPGGERRVGDDFQRQSGHKRDTGGGAAARNRGSWVPVSGGSATPSGQSGSIHGRPAWRGDGLGEAYPERRYNSMRMLDSVGCAHGRRPEPQHVRVIALHCFFIPRKQFGDALARAQPNSHFINHSPATETAALGTT